VRPVGGCENETKRNSPAAGVPKGGRLALSLVTGCQYPWYGLLASQSGHLLVAQAEGTGQVSDRSRGHSLTDRRFGGALARLGRCAARERLFQRASSRSQPALQMSLSAENLAAPCTALSHNQV
jgi:hypothetical protein